MRGNKNSILLNVFVDLYKEKVSYYYERWIKNIIGVLIYYKYYEYFYVNYTNDLDEMVDFLRYKFFLKMV